MNGLLVGDCPQEANCCCVWPTGAATAAGPILATNWLPAGGSTAPWPGNWPGAVAYPGATANPACDCATVVPKPPFWTPNGCPATVLTGAEAAGNGANPVLGVAWNWPKPPAINGLPPGVTAAFWGEVPNGAGVVPKGLEAARMRW